MGEVGGEVRKGLVETRVQLGATPEVLESETLGGCVKSREEARVPGGWR